MGELTGLGHIKLTLLHTKETSKTMFGMERDRKKGKDTFSMVIISTGKKNQVCINTMGTSMKVIF